MFNIEFESAPKAAGKLLMFAMAAAIATQSPPVGVIAAGVSIYAAIKLGPSVNRVEVEG